MSTGEPLRAPTGQPQHQVFRTPPLATLGAVVFAVCALPFAAAAPWFWLVYVVPLAITVSILRRRTTVDGDAVTTRTVLRTRRVPWADISSLRLGQKSRVSAVLTDGAELPLPAVRAFTTYPCSPLPAAAGCPLRLPTIPMGQRSDHAGPAIPCHDPWPQRCRCSRAVASHRDG